MRLVPGSAAPSRLALILAATAATAALTAANAAHPGAPDLELAAGYALLVAISALAAFPDPPRRVVAAAPWAVIAYALGALVTLAPAVPHALALASAVALALGAAALPRAAQGWELRLGWAMLAVACVAAVLQRRLLVVSQGPAPDDVVALVAFAVLGAFAVRRWAPRLAQPVAAALAALVLIAAGGAMVLGTPYHSDAVAATHEAALLLKDGQHPYGSFDMVRALARSGLAPEMATHLEDGSVLGSYNYPAVSFLLPLPLVIAGLADLRWLYLGEVVVLGLLLAGTVPAGWRPLALATVVANPLILRQSVAAGVDPLWALLVLIAWRLRHSVPPSAVALGLAVATRQTAWLFVPFFLAAMWRERGGRASVRWAGLVAAAALLPNLPFLVTAPAAFAGGVFAPLLAPLEPHGVGLVLLAREGLIPALPRGAHALLALLAGALAIAAVWRRWPRLRAGVLAFALLPLYVAWRSLQNYFAFLPVLGLAAIEPEDAAGRRVRDAVDTPR